MTTNSKQMFLTIATMVAGAFQPVAWADQTRQDMQQVRAAVAAFLTRHTHGTPGKLSMEVGKIDARLVLNACARLETFFPAGSRAWGATRVGVRCTAPSPWTLYVAARVIVSGHYLIAARPLRAGQTIATEDFAMHEGELSDLPVGVLTDPAQVLGRSMKQGLQAGQPLRQDILRETLGVQPGQQVILMAGGRGFSISSEGRALGKAAVGAVVQVRTLSGAVVSGIVGQGSVVQVFQ